MTVPASSPPKRISISMKVALITIPAILMVALIAIIIALSNRPEAPDPEAVVSTRDTVATDSHVLDSASEEAPTLVEFLDFECEVCGAVYPYVEQIRQDYRGQINYVVRYFPIPGHQNSMNAAIAVEAAAQQGMFEEMYRKMFETQAEWGEKQDSEADRFRSFAEELGLDIAVYDEAVADPATQKRVQKDFDAGIALGVNGTPTFFLDGEMLQLQEITDLTDAIDQSIGERGGA